ncbi:hypothetical protein LWI28_024555 [Acer negundo]|uniref:Uncharacterized protein n=1 Tax=Acer negundo TaxID=4023 RepID=A0AAD5IAM3_ACENE|nr:hypothetical protein LWI28_024555 [Acer negundo]
MRNQLKDSLKTPEEERYSGKITRHDHFDDLTDIDNALNKVPEHLVIEERRRYTESCFGHLLRMDRGMKFSAGIVHRLLIRDGNCGAHTLRLIEYLAANRDTFDWSENEMGTIREKMAVKVYCNSKDWSSS